MITKCSTVAPWSFDTNWAIAHGSLRGSVNVESSEYPIAESDTDDAAQKSPPLVLKPYCLDSGPCEIKICFGKKYDVCQIYVRSTARVYEVYYSHSPQSSNEYLCTVRCNAAERDEKVLETTGVEYVSEEHSDCFEGELPYDIATDRSGGAAGDDDWVKIKVLDVGQSSSDMIATNKVKHLQDLYEATAQISNAEPCSLLTIRFLSLQNKSHVYVDEVYIFAEHAESTDSANEAVVAGSSTGNPLMSMLLPALLQSARSGISRNVKDNHASAEPLKDDKIEARFGKADAIDVESSKKRSDQQYLEMLDAASLAEHQKSTSPPDTKKYIEPMINIGVDIEVSQSSNLQEHDKDMDKLTEPQQHLSALNIKPIDTNDLLAPRLERALEQLISRVSRVEDICLRFEEKVLKPIESMDSRILHLELQLQNLTRNSLCSELPRSSAPAFCCSISSSSSSNDEESDCPPGVTSGSEKKKFVYGKASSLSPSANFQPSLVVSAPEFSCGEDEEEDNDTLFIEPKKPLSVDDALAAALAGFVSTTKTNPSDHIQTSCCPSNLVDEGIHGKNDEFCQKRTQEFTSAENCRRESSQFSQSHSDLVSDYKSAENDDEVHLNFILSSSDAASAYENKERDHNLGMNPSGIQSKHSSVSADSCDFNENNICDLVSACNGSFHVEILESDANSSCGSGVCCDNTDVGNLVVTDDARICKESNVIEAHTEFLEDREIVKHVLELDSETTSVVLERYIAEERCFEDTPIESSCVSPVDFEFPNLDVEFTFNDHTNNRSPLEALLDEVAESNADAHALHDLIDNDENAVRFEGIDGGETANLLPKNSLLMDLGVYSEDESSNTKVDGLCSPASQEMIGSLI